MIRLVIPARQALAFLSKVKVLPAIFPFPLKMSPWQARFFALLMLKPLW